MKKTIQQLIRDSLEVKKKILEENVDVIEKITRLIVSAYRNNKKVVVFGNGGSAGDAQHLVGELVCRFEKNRRSLKAIALTTNTSLLTAIGNDYGFDRVFSRQAEAMVDRGDVVIGITTSGSSKNVLEALKQAKKQGAKTVGFTGEKCKQLCPLTDICLCIPSASTARIQEGHILAIHIICKLIEQELFRRK
ncbi:MAG: phosphoheptose isomerase [Elusimicrobia bacterium CG1_02_37_114]|nr:MAG: phosphoheptose isomerase [Elusimicrobia bacterium CG1_02_37_114]PIV53345.1 MAG: phosphoheptose isomerase [Elusimicrobia bacterium CG02_land_8_20_14_3_00_37_13]